MPQYDERLEDSEVYEPFPYQLTGADWLASKDAALLADEMGLGKSAQAVRGADLVGAKRILVVCPASLRINWCREFRKFSPLDRPLFTVDTKKDPLPDDPGVVVISYDLAWDKSQELKRIAWDLMILDEAHYLKSRSTRRTWAVYGRSIKVRGLTKYAKRVWALTGTPAPNNASELWTHLHFNSVTPMNFWDFTFRYCDGYDNSYGYQITGHKNVDELKAMLKPYVLRRTKESVAMELPPITYHSLTVPRSKVDLDPTFLEAVLNAGGVPKFMDKLKQDNDILSKALKAAGSNVGRDEARLATLEGMASSMVTLRRYIGMAKLPAILDIIEDELRADPALKMVLFAVHKDVIEATRQRFTGRGIDMVTLYGATPMDGRQAHVDRFQTLPKCRLFVGNIQAAGVGITLTAANEVVFLEQDWVPANNAQAAMRCHRIGQTRAVRVRIFSLHKSIDEQVQTILRRKSQALAQIGLK